MRDEPFMSDSEERSLVEKLGLEFARSRVNADLRWLEGQPAAIRALVYEYDTGPVRMAIRVGCTLPADIDKLCGAMRARGMRRSVKPAQVKALADRLRISRGKPVSARTQALALRAELERLDRMIAQSKQMSEPELGQTLAVVLSDMRFLRDDMSRLPKN